MSTRISQSPTQRIRNLEQNVRSIRDLLHRLKQNASSRDLAEIHRVLEELKPAISSSTTLQHHDDRLQTMLGDRHCLLQRQGAKRYYGPRSGPAAIIALLEFFDGTDARDIHIHLLHLFGDAGYVKGDLSEMSTNSSQLPSQDEMHKTCRLVLSLSHPFLQFLNAKILQETVQKAYQSTADEIYHRYHWSLCHMIVALSQVLDLDTHRRLGCEQSVDTAYVRF